MNFIKFKKIEIKDKNIIYKWRIKKKVKKYLLHQKITKSSHSAWFKKKIKSSKYSAWIILINKKKIGLIQTDSIGKSKSCNAGFYIANTNYSFLSFEVICLLNNFVFNTLKFNKIESYISKENLNIRKLNKINGYIELSKKFNYNNFIITYLTKSNWKKSKGYNYYIKRYGKL